MNVLIATPELGDAATLSSPGAVAPTLPLTNLQHYLLSRVCRFTSLSNITIYIDLGSTRAIDLVALLGTNATSAATWRVRTAGTQSDTSPAPNSDSGTVLMNPQAVLVSIGASDRWIRIDIDDALNPDGFFDIGRLYVAGADTFWQPELNAADPFDFEVEDDSQVATTVTGGLLTKVRNQRRVLRHLFDFQDESEIFGRAYRIVRARGTGRDVLMMTDAEGDYVAEQTIYGLLTQSQQLSHRGAELFAWQATVRELIA